MKIKFKKLVKHAILPRFGHPQDAAMDLFAADSGYYNEDYDFFEIGTGLAALIPEGYVGFIFPRSSISKTNLSLCNAVGIIDSGFTGEIKLRFRKVNEKEYLSYGFGDKVGQLLVIPIPRIEPEFTDELLPTTSRGTGGFGSTDAKSENSCYTIGDLSDSVSFDDEEEDIEQNY